MINRKHKDAVFCLLFGSEKYKQNALDLYNAINGSNHKNLDDLQFTTIEDAIYMGVKNDVSFLIDNEMYLCEEQSSHNPNMPLRGLDYFARLYSKYEAEHQLDIYSSKLLQLPTPRYFVFYLGTDKRPEREELKLSSSFAHPEIASVEVIATVLNINYPNNQILMDNCKALKGYAQLIAMIRANRKNGMGIEDAIDTAIKRCIDEGILKDFLVAHRAEVKAMYATTLSFEETCKHIRDKADAELAEKDLQLAKARADANMAEKKLAEAQREIERLKAMLNS